MTHLTTKELAERLKKKSQTLANWRVKGLGPGFIPGRPVLYPLSEVEAWERANVVRSVGGNNA